MEILLREKGIYKVNMETEVEPNAAVEKIKWHNRRDEAYGLLCLSISRDLLFHLDWLTDSNKVSKNLEDIFQKYRLYERTSNQEWIDLLESQ